MSNVKLVSTPILNYYDSKLKKFLSSTYALKSDVSDGGGILYAECSTAYNINNKVVACGGFALQKGACIAIMFTDASTTAPTTGNITLNINNTGAKTIVPKGNNTVITQGWAWAFRANQTQVFMYNGTNFIWLNQDNNTTYTPMALGFGYGTCTTAEATTAKVATLTSYVLIKGGMVSVKFTNAVPASATLNINGKGAKYIYYHGAKILAGIINANDIATFVYDGTEYQLIAIDNEARIKANASDIAKNAAAIQKINDESSGAVATSKGYTDSEINKVSANVTANTNAIGAINNTSTGILAQAKKYVDGILPTASVANADTIDGKGIADLVLNESINEAVNRREGVPNNVNVAEWLRQNARRGMNYITNDGNVGLTGLPGNYPYWAWYSCDGCNIFAKTMDNRFFYLWELNSAGYQWRQIQFTDNIDFQVHTGELDANDLKEINPGIFGYKCTHWKNHPSENFDSQGTIINISYGTSGANHWYTQYFISPHNSDVWKRCFSTTNMTEWERITHHFWSGTTTAKSNTLNFKPSMVIVFTGDFVSATNTSNGFITITNTGFDFASAPDKAYGVYAFA